MRGKALALLLACSIVVGAISQPVQPVRAEQAVAQSTSQNSAETTGSVELATQEVTATVYTDASLQTTMPAVSIQIQGVLPIGCCAMAYPVDAPSEVGDVLVAYDITVYQVDGQKFQPGADAPLTVNILVPDMPDGVFSDDLTLVYLPEEGAPEVQEAPVTVTDEGVSFMVEHFSTYAVTIASVAVWSVDLDGLAQTVTTLPSTGTNRTASSSSTIYSQYPGQVHTIDLSVSPPNVNLTITSIKQNGTEILSTPGSGSSFSKTVDFTDSTTLVIAYHNNANPVVYVTLTCTITVIQPDLGVEDTIAQNGLLTALLKNALVAPSSTVTYTWTKSAAQNGTYGPVSSQALSSDGSSINVAVDGGGRMWYKVTASIDNGDGTTAQIASTPFQVPYYMSLQNGSFETPTAPWPAGVTGNANYRWIPNGTPGLVWKTTASDGQIEFGINVSASSPYNIHSYADGGKQFAELNADSEGTLYQDVLVVPGETLFWSLAHAGRNGSDTMNVVIMPTADVPPGLTTAQAENIVTSADGRTVARIITSPAGSWSYYNNYATGYVVPKGVYVVRFFFASKSATGNNKTIGNLLDAITFSAAEPYTVEYYLNGVLMPGLTVTGVESPDTTITAQTPPGWSDYHLQKTVLNGKDLDKMMEFDLLVPRSVLQLYYVSTGLIVYKDVSGVASADMPASYVVNVELYEGSSASGTPKATGAITMASGSITGSYQFVDGAGAPIVLMPNATYTVKEVLPSPDPISNYSYQSSTMKGSTYDTAIPQLVAVPEGPGSTFTFTTAPAGVDIYEVSFTNTYAKVTTPFQFTKTAADKTTPLIGVDFTLYPIDPNTGKVDATKTPLTATSDDNGLVDFGDLTSGDYLLEETKPLPGFQAPLGNWTISVEATNTIKPITIKANGSPPAFAGSGVTVFILPNYPEMTLPFSGGFGMLTFIVLGVALIGCAGIAFTLTCKHTKGKGVHKKT